MSFGNPKLGILLPCSDDFTLGAYECDRPFEGQVGATLHRAYLAKERGVLPGSQ